ncbi:MAG: hypothetical protein EBR30_16930 [Cytophagia bacterium]|nr:hypothetical protein [Cytophagia bacterium]
MTTKEKAKELVEKYLPLVDCGDNRYTTKVQKENAKQCALIAVDEIIYQLHVLPYGMEYLLHIDYWEGVKQQIENMKGGEQ